MTFAVPLLAFALAFVVVVFESTRGGAKDEDEQEDTGAGAPGATAAAGDDACGG